MTSRVYDREESIERRHTVYQMYAESNVTSCICHKLGICTLTNPSVGDVIYQDILLVTCIVRCICLRLIDKYVYLLMHE